MTVSNIFIENLPDKTRYRAGQAIDYSGLAVTYKGRDVTGALSFDVEEGTVWGIEDKEVDVTATYEPTEGEALHVTFTLKRKKRIWPFLLLALAILALVEGVLLGMLYNQGTEPGGNGGEATWEQQARDLLEDDSGAYLISQGDMTREEAQAMLDEITEKSRITVSVAPEMVLRDDGSLRVNFAVPKGNNGLSERLEVIQDGKVVYSSGIVNPGYMVEWVPASGAKAGDATATVHAVDPETRQDSGNPFSVEVKVVE